MHIEARIADFINEELLLGTNQDPDLADQSLIKSGILDSLSLLRLIHFLEGEFGVTIEDGEVSPENFETIDDIKIFIARKQST